MTPRLCLASQSPRRAELLRQAGYEFEIVEPKVDETMTLGEDPPLLTERLSMMKAAAAKTMLGPDSKMEVFLGSDTIVVVDGEALGKPRSECHAKQMLRRLSGRTHEVITAVSVLWNNQQASEVVTSEVMFCSLSEALIDDYCASEEPFDKAGGYAIQGRAAVFVENLRGSYYGVMGLPLRETFRLLNNANVYPTWHHRRIE